ncbi:lipoate--protein ligase family protein [Natrialbaceae archaeon AArc-T1-2]|uniref:lipoate--protein ligase family protein n=1 Tax=Natrialbaceae archaeon AArc-T1-2 TaxID=3053904 RepID=UPI00255B246C|nr:biotin/lipoate A/B protein ligase family protein [Natrialbaceae archaeon AArc-T1-2]WIV68041.1 biotin/lipoate A/B protein ligase family protein [Natrialbaceae archaeon AArc-T1-2]
MTDVAGREWRLVRDDARDGPTQMALEEVAGETALAEGVRTVRVFSWEPSTLSLGYRTDADAVDWTFCERAGIDVTRRQTGGGGIYHDAYADISYTIVAPAEDVPSDLMDCYRLFCEPILAALETMGVDAGFAATERAAILEPSCYLRDVHPAHDVVAPASDGRAKKLSGNAQYRQRDVVIQHGSISYAREPARHLGVFADHETSSAAFTDRVTSIREQAAIDRETAVETLADALGEWCNAEEGDWREDELEAARELAADKYGTDAWIRDRDAQAADSSR